MVKLLKFCMALVAAYGALFVFADFHDIPCNDVRDFAVLSLQFMAIETGVLGLMCLISADKYVFSALFPPLTLLCTVLAYFRYTATVLAYFRYTANATLNAITLDLTLTNDLATSMDTVSWQLVALCLLSVAASVWIAWYRCRHIRFAGKAVNKALWLVELRAHKQRRGHSHTVYALYERGRILGVTARSGRRASRL